jgi:hypothetical protein
LFKGWTDAEKYWALVPVCKLFKLSSLFGLWIQSRLIGAITIIPGGLWKSRFPKNSRFTVRPHYPESSTCDYWSGKTLSPMRWCGIVPFVAPGLSISVAALVTLSRALDGPAQ